MPFDAVMLSAVRAELEGRLAGARIDKVFQPEKDEVVLQMHGMRESFRLLLSAGPNHARIHIATEQKENPQTPPMFCMLMRKYLTGGIVRAVTQPPLERLLEFEIDVTDEMGLPGRRSLVLEMIGRQSNLIFLDGERRIVESLRRVEADITDEKSSARQILPGMFYRLPAPMEKSNPLETSAAELAEMIQNAAGETKVDKWLLDMFFGISPLIAREMSFRASGDVSAVFSGMDASVKAHYVSEVSALFDRIRTGAAEPFLLLEDGEPHDLAYLPITQYGQKYELRKMSSFSELVETYFADRDKTARMRSKTHELNRMAAAALERVRRKVAQQKIEYEAAKKRERLRESGDLLMANLHRIEKGQRAATVQDFYDPEGKDTVIAIDPRLSAQQNAAKYYKDYNRMKNAERILTVQIASGEHEEKYLESVLDELAHAETERDVRDIREELQKTGYVRAERGKKVKKQAERLPRAFLSSGGFTILAGRNNEQNDKLTLKESGKNDIWFHTQKFPGSHVIIRCDGKEPDDQTYTEAAMIAAFFSRAADGQNVPVDYTRVRNVKKPSGARPGMVIYDPYFTAYATPDKNKIEKLRIK